MIMDLAPFLVPSESYRARPRFRFTRAGQSNSEFAPLERAGTLIIIPEGRGHAALKSTAGIPEALKNRIGIPFATRTYKFGKERRHVTWAD